MDLRDARNGFIVEKFAVGYTPTEIHRWLSNKFGIEISLSTVKRVLKHMGLRRNSSTYEEVVAAILNELQEGGGQIGYRSMWLRLKTKFGIHTCRDVVQYAMALIDPEGCQSRKGRRLKRRRYMNRGPNYLIHIDQNDKLRRYGLCLHAAIDGWSRRVLWVMASRTNRDPKVVAAYYLDYINEIQAVPRMLRMDHGTENVTIADMQMTLRHDHQDDFPGNKSVILGPSTANQRIEQWWGRLRVEVIEEYRNLLEAMEDGGLFNNGVEMHVELVRFCFMRVLQNDLDVAKASWNCHLVRQNRHVDSPSGKPDMMFNNPELFNGTDFCMPVDMDDLPNLEQFVKRPLPCLPEYSHLFEEVMEDNGLVLPSNVTNAAKLYADILDAIF